jgi:hypothetical protein
VQGLPLLLRLVLAVLLGSSNGFVRTKPYLLFLNKNNAPHECGNPKCKVIALGWLSDEQFPRHHDISDCFACNRRARPDRVGRRADAELHQLACVVPGDAPS